MNALERYATLIYILCFVGPIAYQRTKFRFWPKSFDRLGPLRRLTGLDLHHGHFGLILVIAVGVWNTQFEHRLWISALFYFGLGLLADEIIPHVSMPQLPREKELEVYARHRWSTAALATLFVVVFSAIGAIKSLGH